MSQRTRLLLVGLAVIVLVVAFVIASSSGGDDEGGGQADNPPVTAATSTPATTPAPDAPDTTPTTPTEPESAPAPPPPLVRVVDGEPVGGVERLEYKSGDRVRFRVRSNTADQVHVHGYDIERDLPADQTVTLSFDGDIEGRFEVELHHSGNQIAELEVAP